MLERLGVNTEKHELIDYPKETFHADIVKNIMLNIYKNSSAAAEKYGHKDNLVIGANIAGFIKVAEAMKAQGIV